MKRPIRNIIWIILLILGNTSCIEFFHPDINNIETKYVVDGVITDQEGFQTVLLSSTSDVEVCKYNPLPYCKIFITDDLGNIFNLTEAIPGTYKVWMGKEYLVPGRSYKINITTPSGIEIVSDYDQMYECPKVDSVYYIRKNVQTSNSLIVKQGIQFYVDIDGRSTNTSFYRWELNETWEHHAPASPASICWTTKKLNDIYILSTKKLTQNIYTRFPFHFVDNQTQRLNYCYSLLITQFAISEPAYEFWNKLRINSSELDGLYSTQPLRIKGNLKSTTNPELDILGFFSATSKKSKRIFVQNVPDLEIIDPICIPDVLPNGVIVIGPSCTDCAYWDGSTDKPKFWPY